MREPAVSTQPIISLFGTKTLPTPEGHVSTRGRLTGPHSNILQKLDLTIEDDSCALNIKNHFNDFLGQYISQEKYGRQCPVNGLVEISRIGCVALTMLAADLNFGPGIPSSSSSLDTFSLGHLLCCLS